MKIDYYEKFYPNYYDEILHYVDNFDEVRKSKLKFNF